MQNKIKQKENAGATGIVTITRYKPGTLAKVALHIKEGRPLLARELLRKNTLGVAVRQSNMIVSSANYGKNLIAQRLGGVNTYTLNITHGDIGTGSTAPTLADTNLQTGTTRRAVETASVSNNVVTVRFFFSDANLANGTYYEFGTFVDGTSTLGTGKLFNRALFSTPYVKATSEDTTVDVEFTIS